MLSSVAQFEREMMLERQREGIAGQSPKVNTGADNQQHAKTDSVKALIDQNIPKDKAKDLGTVASLYRILSDLNKDV